MLRIDWHSTSVSYENSSVPIKNFHALHIVYFQRLEALPLLLFSLVCLFCFFLFFEERLFQPVSNFVRL